MKKSKTPLLLKSKALKLGLLATALLIVANLMASPTYTRPQKTVEFAKTSVRITNMAQNSGGSGVIYRSSKNESIILTNRHVCMLAAKGGMVLTETDKYMIAAIKPSTIHDICEVKVNADLHVNTKIADEEPEIYSDAYISGHPLLYPHILTKGHFSGKMMIQIMTGTRQCTKKDMETLEGVFICAMLGGWPIIETLETQVVSATILPGSSGSGVFNSDGEIVGLAFASSSRELSYALIVPHKYLVNFLKNEAPKADWQNIKYEHDL